MSDLIELQKTLDQHGERLERIEHIIIGDVGEDGKARPGVVPRLERIENLIDESKNIMTDGIKQLVKLAGRGIWALLVAIVSILAHLALGAFHAR